MDIYFVRGLVFAESDVPVDAEYLDGSKSSSAWNSSQTDRRAKAKDGRRECICLPDP